jgi:hypothetical protein
MGGGGAEGLELVLGWQAVTAIKAPGTRTATRNVQGKLMLVLYSKIL